MRINYNKERGIMQPFNYADNKVIHLLSTYISEGYLFPDVIEKDCKFVLVTPKVIHKYKFVWSSLDTKVKCNPFSYTIYVPRHINNDELNTKLSSILYFGFDIFNIIATREVLWYSPWRYFKEFILKSNTNRLSIAKRLKKFFQFLSNANEALIEAYNNYPLHPVNYNDLDAAFIKYQSHIFLASTLFELYHPFELL